MYKIGVCGHFGNEKNLLNGQTIKTKLITEELKRHFGSHKLKTIDSHGWKRNPIKLIIKSFLLMVNCQNIIIMPANNGLKVFAPLFFLFKKFFNNKKLHYVVIGGWLPELLEKNPSLKNILQKFDTIFVETYKMIEDLDKLGLKNIEYLPNFKRLEILEENELEYNLEEPYKLCTFSRVIKEKGIEDAIEAVKKLNRIFDREIFILDIYGQIDEKYMERFEKLEENFPSYISYKGMVNFNDTVDILKKYFVLLFPTHFRTEGIPGTIIDAYAAGIPVIASNWNSAEEIIIQDQTGYIYNFMQTTELEEILYQIAKEPLRTNSMKKKCLKRAKQYSSKKVIGEFVKHL
ncbi:glycosyltransferase family 1 protein [Neobacillus piezotolerans]|uniref:Glycosyltransferase family 1 protein n=1 Tax=Neobacillus piezotolerans TaxID=2259171 RepID=A0A3D8GST3_9BACI|nr:glycosyltransferase [Neobacillus piezotolerans]RDU37126.1 glycosyltransferase family 1 protein [Neobacillus piezotolerans]